MNHTWKVLPLKPGEKTPLTRHGVKDATADPATIDAWKAANPDANWGTATGDGLVVIDIDARHDGHKSLAALEAEFGELPATAEVITGGDGRHLYFACNEKLGNRSNVRPGIDVRGDGGYVVAPPSIHQSGKRYAWRAGRAPGEIELAPLPAWLLELIQKPKPATAVATPTGNIEPTLAAMRKITVADNNDGSKRLFTYACRCVEHDLSDADAVRAIQIIQIERPFAKSWSAEQIIARIRDAERTVVRGSEVNPGPSLWQAEGRTDAANAKRFARMFGDRIRWCDAIEQAAV